MFIPAFKTAALLKKSVSASITGEASFSVQKLGIGWSPIYMRNDDVQTAVRADSSASKSRADINAGEYRILLTKDAQGISIGDLILLPETQTFNSGYQYRVTRLLPRHDVFGRLHHLEVDIAKYKAAMPANLEAVKTGSFVSSFRVNTSA